VEVVVAVLTEEEACIVVVEHIWVAEVEAVEAIAVEVTVVADIVAVEVIAEEDISLPFFMSSI
jgi:hypothetical protein